MLYCTYYSATHFKKPGRFLKIFIYLFCGCAGSSLLCRFFCNSGKWGLLSHFGAQTSCSGFAVVECGLQSICASVVMKTQQSLDFQTQFRLNTCGAWPQLPCSVWDVPGSGMEPMSPALPGGFFTTEPPGKPETHFFFFSY